MKKRILAVLLVLFAAFGALNERAYGQNTSPIDLLLLLDTSSAMNSSYDNVSDYITGSFLREFLRVGDTFHLIPFSETPRLDAARRIIGVGDVETIIGRMLLQYPIENASNVSSALTYAEQYISTLPNRSKKIVLVTTGSSATSSLLTSVRQRLSSLNTTIDYVQVTPAQSLSNLPSSGRTPLASQPPADADTSAVSATPSTAARPQTTTTTPSTSTTSTTPSTTTGTTPAATPASTTAPSTTPTTPSTTTGTTPATKPASTTSPSASNTTTQTTSTTPTTPSTTTGTTPAATPASTTSPSASNTTTQTTSTTPSTPSTTTGTTPAATPASTTSPSASNAATQTTSTTPTTPVSADSTTETAKPTDTSASPAGTTTGIDETTGITQTDSSAEKSESTIDDKSASSKRTPAPSSGTMKKGRGFSLLFIILIIILALLILGLIIFLLSRRLSSSPKRAMSQVSSAPADTTSDTHSHSNKDNSEELASFAAGITKQRSTPYDNRPVKADAGKPVVINPSGTVLLNLFVEDQNTSIGKRNIHSLKSGYSLTVGGGKADDYLIFLVPLPQHIGEIRRDGSSLTFIPKKAKYFPDIGSNEVRDCINKTIRVVSDKKYEMRFRFEMYEDPLIALNRLLHSVKVPG